MADLRDDWWTHDLGEHIDLDLPGIYEWRIGSESLYIGKSVRLRNRIREYPNNVRKLVAGKSYRKNKPNCFRDVHYELRAAHDGNIPVTVAVLENCASGDLNERERYWIAIRRSQAKQNGPRVLNATKEGK